MSEGLSPEKEEQRVPAEASATEEGSRIDLSEQTPAGDAPRSGWRRAVSYFTTYTHQLHAFLLRTGRATQARARHIDQSVRSSKVAQYVKLHRKAIALGLLAAVLLLFAGTYTVFREKTELPLWMSYGESYRLVPATVSQSAVLAIAVPEEAGVVQPEQVSFDPPLQGTFVASESASVLYYKPKEELVLDSYYRVVLSYATTSVEDEFQVVEDPRVVSILPVGGAEVDEETKVSVIFNRPMVPLTTRAELDQASVPVRLEPETPGVWKWKSTRLLQFVPETDLTRATKYTVTVQEGFRSLDGVPVEGFSHEFTTRTLKMTGATETLRFDEPIELRFNQPINLEKTAHEITVTENGSDKDVSVTYGTKRKEGRKLFGLAFFSVGAEEEDTSTILISPHRDKHGRKGLWDFESSYDVSLKNAYPTEGTEVLKQPLARTYTLPTILSSYTAASERSAHTEPDFFDPEGELVLSFYEPVDIDKTPIALEGLRDVRYGEICKKDADGNEIRNHETKTCVKEENKNELRVRVDPARYTPDLSTTLTIEKVVSEEGFELSSGAIVLTVHTVPELRVLAQAPAQDSTAGSVTELLLCTNTPLKNPEPNTLRTILKTEGYVVYPNNAWQSSYRVTNNNSRSPCQVGAFVTHVRYGLHPEKAYTFDLHLTDEFDTTVDTALSFTTQKAPDEYTRFISLQKEYNVTTPDKTRLTYAVENLPYVQVFVCKVSAATMLTALETESLKNELPPSSWCIERTSATIDLPDTYWVNNYFYFDLARYIKEPLGQYIITFTSPTYRNRKNVQQYAHTLLSVSNLTVGEKRVNWYTYNDNALSSRKPVPDAQNLYWVLDSTSLEPVPGAKVVPYTGTDQNRSKNTLVAGQSAFTTKDGLARSRATEKGSGATITSGADSALVSNYTDTLVSAWNGGSESNTYLYTDRPIYRPGDTVHLKGIDRVGYDHTWLVPKDYTAPVKVFDAANNELYTQDLPVSKYGTFSATLTLPADAPLGTYRIEAFENSGWFDVEEYVGAAFNVEVSSTEEEYLAGDTARFAVEARYYFDMPVSDAEVEYTVLAQDYYFDRYRDEYFSFGQGWYSCYACGYGDEFVTRGTLTLDKHGKATIEVPLDFTTYFDDPEEAGSKLFTVIARVKNQTGAQIVAQNTAIVHRGAFYLGVKTEQYVGSVNEPVPVRVKSVDTKGIPIAASGITLSANKLTWESYRRREVDGGYYYHSEERREEVFNTTVRTDRDGNASYSHTFTEPGRYELRVTKRDAAGNPVTGVTNLYVVGSGYVSVRPTNNESLVVTTDKPSYEPGETAKVLIESPFTRARALITTERGDVYQYWTYGTEDSLITQEIPVRDTYAPNAYASVLLVGPGPEVKYGNVEISVAKDAYELTVETTADKAAYLPGEEVTLSVHTSHRGKPVPAEVSLAVVDMSVLALKGNPKKDPVSFFYGSLPLGVRTAHSAKNMLIEQDIPTGTKGGGGGDAEDLKARKRGVFKDTAYWSANVTTNEAGEAHLTFRLPDNLTTWQIESLGVTENTLLGVTYREFTSKKPVMAVPQKPRFVIPGDTAWLGMQLINSTDRAVVLRAHIESETLNVIDTDTNEVRVGAGESRLVYFKTEVPTDMQRGIHTVTFFAKGDSYEDTVEQLIPIRKDQTFEVTATAGVSRARTIRESIYVPDYALDEGELTVTARPTLVTSLLSAVGDIAGYPYGCSEQIASKLASLATITRSGQLFGTEQLPNIKQVAFDDVTYDVDEAIKNGLRDLLARQKEGGGFPFYEQGDPSGPLTAEVLSALSVLRDTGYRVPDDVFTRGASYLTDEVSYSEEYRNNDTLLASAAFALSSKYVPEAARTPLEQRITALSRDKKRLERLSTTALGHFAIATYQTPYKTEVSDVFFAALQNRLVVDARGAYVKSNRQSGWSWFESIEKNTALFVRAIADRGGDHVVVDSLLRYLNASKVASGGWGSTNSTFAVLDSALRLADVRKENKSSYLLTLLHNDEPVATHTVASTTLFTVFEYVFPMQTFARNTLEHIRLEKTEDGGEGSVYYDMQLRYSLPADMVPPRDEGITVERTLTALGGDEPIHEAAVGDLVQGALDIVIPEEYHAVSIESFIPAGFEIVNLNLSTESSRDLDAVERENQEAEGQQGMYRSTDPRKGPAPFPVTFEESHDDRVFVFAETVRPGTYRFEYLLRARIPGTYRHMPATVQEMYTPEVFGRTSGETFTVTE